MKRLCMLGLVALLSAPAAFAGQMPAGSIAGYLTQSGFDTGNVDDDGLGFGIRGWASVSGPWFVHGEYQSAKTDDFDVDLQSLRLGGGYAGSINPTAMWLVKAEFIDFGSDVDQDGLGIHGGVMFFPSQEFGFFGTLGYITTDDTDGLELDVGGKLSFTKEWSGVLDYRTYMGDVDGGGDLDLNDLRIGVAYSFY